MGSIFSAVAQFGWAEISSCDNCGDVCVCGLGLPCQFFPGILLSRKPPETQGKRPASEKNEWLRRMGNHALDVCVCVGVCVFWLGIHLFMLRTTCRRPRSTGGEYSISFTPGREKKTDKRRRKTTMQRVWNMSGYISR